MGGILLQKSINIDSALQISDNARNLEAQETDFPFFFNKKG
jgi:hypothetical protein